MILFVLFCTSGMIQTSVAPAVGDGAAQVVKSTQRVLSVEVACSESVILGRVFLSEPFHGILYALGFPNECRTLGNGTKEVRLAFTADRCGTKVSNLPDGRPNYEALVYLQFDRKMQQALDETILLKCSPKDVVVRSAMSPGVVQRSSADTPSSTQVPNRMHDSWMDILYGKMPSAIPIIKPVHVGEDLTMLIKVRHTAELGSKVIDCKANDGTEKSQQQLIDYDGCTVDADIIPDLKEKHTIKTGIKMIYASFKAFKFPVRNSLHLRCRVVICNGTCPVENCGKSQWSIRRRARGLSEDFMNRIIEEIPVYNSVEVIDIKEEETMKKSSKISTSYKEISGGIGTPEEILCLTSTRMIILFGFLLSVLLVSLVVTICMCVKAKELRRRLMVRQSFPYGRVSQCS